MSNLNYYYDFQQNRWFLEFDGDTVLSCSNEMVEKKLVDDGCYDSHMECFKMICADEIVHLIDHVDLTFSMKWVLTHMFKYDICMTKGGN